MKRIFILPTIVFLLLAVLPACKKPGCFEEAGVTTLTERKAAAFHQIDLYDDMDLVLTQAPEEKIWVEAASNIQPNIGTVITDGVLTIQNNTSCNWLRSPLEKVRVHVSFKNLDKIN